MFINHRQVFGKYDVVICPNHNYNTGIVYQLLYKMRIFIKIIKQYSPAGNNISRDEKGDPTDDDEHGGGEIAGDDVVRYLPH